MKGRFAHCMSCLLLALLVTSVVPGGQTTNDGPEVGLDDLEARIGTVNLPTGADVIAGHVEFADNDGDYQPTVGHNQFVGKTFFAMSGPTGASAHANTVGFNYYGKTISIAPGIILIYNWWADHWATNGLLNTNTASLPAALPAAIKVFNHSWIGTFGLNSQNNNALRRADFIIVRDDLIMCLGVSNDEPGIPDDDVNVALMSHVYNGITVGVSDGTHMNDPTLGGLDGPGRMQPIIVAPGTKVSWAIPVVAAAGALMTETARNTPLPEGINAAAERSEVIKAMLLAGANHRAGWTNNPATSGPERGVTSQPVDDVFGAGLLDVNISHLILTRGEQDGSPSPPASINAGKTGWDLASVALNSSVYWRLAVCDVAGEVSVAATWHRHTESPFQNADWAVADFTLTLWRIDGQGRLATLVGDPGVPFFAGGNVVSESVVDNLEHLFVTGLEPGEYVIELSRHDGGIAFPDWDAAVAWHVDAPDVPGDANGDCVVGIDDFLIVLGSWGPCPEPCPVVPCPGDFNGDCEVGINDFLAVIGNWG